MKEMIYYDHDLALNEIITLDSGIYRDIPYLILNVGPYPCAYIGLPIDNILTDIPYLDIPLNCHGGLSFGRHGDGIVRPKGIFWLGWDYSHAGDYVSYRDANEKKWTTEKLLEEVKSVISDLKGLLDFADRVKFVLDKKMMHKIMHFDEDKAKVLHDFKKKLIESHIDIPPEFERIFRETFWGLLA